MRAVVEQQVDQGADVQDGVAGVGELRPHFRRQTEPRTAEVAGVDGEPVGVEVRAGSDLTQGTDQPVAGLVVVLGAYDADH